MYIKLFIKFISFLSIILFMSSNLSFAIDEKSGLYDVKFSFEGIFGKFNKSSARRGLQIYREVCSGCHGLKFISFRNLTSIGYTESEVKRIASEYEILDGPNNEGEMFIRKGLSSDNFVDPYDNKNMARAMNNGDAPPDLSLIVKIVPSS